MALLTPTDIADRLKVKPVTVLRMFDAGILPGIVLRQGLRKRVIRFREEAIERFIASRERRGKIMIDRREQEA